MELLAILLGLLPLLNIVVLACILPMKTRIASMQDNELHEMRESLRRIEDQLLAHLKWHLEGDTTLRRERQQP